MLTNICKCQSQTFAMSNKDLKNYQKKIKANELEKLHNYFVFPLKNA